MSRKRRRAEETASISSADEDDEAGDNRIVFSLPAKRPKYETWVVRNGEEIFVAPDPRVMHVTPRPAREILWQAVLPNAEEIADTVANWSRVRPFKGDKVGRPRRKITASDTTSYGYCYDIREPFVAPDEQAEFLANKDDASKYVKHEVYALFDGTNEGCFFRPEPAEVWAAVRGLVRPDERPIYLTTESVDIDGHPCTDMAKARFRYSEEVRVDKTGQLTTEWREACIWKSAIRQLVAYEYPYSLRYKAKVFFFTKTTMYMPVIIQ